MRVARPVGIPVVPAMMGHPPQGPPLGGADDATSDPTACTVRDIRNDRWARSRW